MNMKFWPWMTGWTKPPGPWRFRPRHSARLNGALQQAPKQPFFKPPNVVFNGCHCAFTNLHPLKPILGGLRDCIKRNNERNKNAPAQCKTETSTNHKSTRTLISKRVEKTKLNYLAGLSGLLKLICWLWIFGLIPEGIWRRPLWKRAGVKECPAKIDFTKVADVTLCWLSSKTTNKNKNKIMHGNSQS